uniref:Zinc finger CCCH domain-containing protein 39-like n=1 Tax=Elaeis guineensis var. tenera TaxID=51953 RepID=A0A6I9QVD9_ELAGV|nr:zinc finger CCCH domain-containing protein 39-like [Elaeis guineensis]
MDPPPDRALSFFMPPPPFATATSGNVIALRPQNLADQPEFEAPLLTRPRNSDDAPLNPLRNRQPVSTMPRPPNPQFNPSRNPPIRGTSCMFFKTRLCQKFKTGSCLWGNNCNFAHGIEELRQPPPNWQEFVAEERVNGSDRQRMHKNKICRKFFNRQVCPYGDRCTFLHVQRESSGMAMGPMAGPDSVGGFSSAADCNGSNQKPKAKICYKWETTGHCSFGERCIFAHGLAELKKSGGHVELDGGKNGADPPKPLTNSTNNVPPTKAESSCMHEAQQKGVFPKLDEAQQKGVFPKLAKKLSCIYADWIDGAPLCSPHLPQLSKQS